MAARNPLVLVSGIPAELPAGDTVNGAGAATLTLVEVNLGSVPRLNGRFTIAGAGMTVGKPLSIAQASGPYTGKGTREDEAEMGHVTVSGKVTSAVLITCYWTAARRMGGNVKFNYFLGA